MRPVLPFAILALAATPASYAQNPQCAQLSPIDNGRQTCNAAIDFVRAYHPLAGLVISGGNPVIGSGGAAGKLGSFSVTLRANAFSLSVPDLSNVSSSGAVPEDDRVLAPAPMLEGNVGLFPGTESGLLALDLLLAAQLVPNEEFTSDIRVDPNATRIGPFALGFGFGVRVGVLSDRGTLPSISVSLMRRSIPRIGFGDTGAGDEVAGDLDLQATNLRLTAGKRFSVVTVAGGIGWSRYSGDATATYSAGLAQGTIDMELAQSRMLYFLDAGLDLGMLKVVGEIGHQQGKDQNLGTTFDGYDDASGTTFYSLGLRMGI